MRLFQFYYKIVTNELNFLQSIFFYSKIKVIVYNVTFESYRYDSHTHSEKKEAAMLQGVYTAKKKNGTLYYRSSITFSGKHISLGSYSLEKSASDAYQLANKILYDNTITLEMFSPETSVLAFPKWVILLNFRDNGIYIKTPIYLKERFFHYYFGKDDFLTFDIDDLFYYSTRSISRRGGHLFVADYGMQINILSRYGIKNYAVAGRDFRFVNGDVKDFRYENIEIINHYHGVCRREKNGSIYYEAKIHWNGDFLVGRYDTEIEAAVAYNKAASVLIAKGYKKEYPVNYIEELSNTEYRDIYKNVTISQNIWRLTPHL